MRNTPILQIPAEIQRSAILSSCLNYRYVLSRIWDSTQEMMVFIGLNPSTADAEQDDPTIRKCAHFAQQEGCGGFHMLNIFAFRTPYPQELYRQKNGVGPENDRYLREFLGKKGPKVLMWGRKPHEMPENQAFLQNFKGPWQCFSVNKDGSPKHVLYIPAKERMRPYPG